VAFLNLAKVGVEGSNPSPAPIFFRRTKHLESAERMNSAYIGSPAAQRTLLHCARLFPILTLIPFKVVDDTLRGSKIAFHVAQGGAQSFAGLLKLVFWQKYKPVTPAS
jgi:hypothetical protein